MVSLRLSGVSVALWLILGAGLATVDYYPAFPKSFSGHYEDDRGWVAQVTVSRTELNGKSLVRADIVQNGSADLVPASDRHLVVYTRPPGALRGTRAFNSTVMFSLGDGGCEYTVYGAKVSMPMGLAHLLGLHGVLDDDCVGFYVCSGMKYVETLIYFNRKADSWFKQIPNIEGGHDNLTVLVDSATHIPFWALRYHPGHPGTFDPPMSIETAVNVTSKSPGVDFSLPQEWQMKCHNLDAEVLTDGKGIFYSTPKGSDLIHVWLSAMPVGGNVTLTFQAHAIAPCPCTTCIQFQPKSVTFTPSNYTQKQAIEFVYEKDGITNFMFVVSGGGYYNRYSDEYGTIYSCQDGTPGKSC